MAHFAKLDDNNLVIDVNCVANAALDPLNEEASGIAFLTEWSGGYTNWKQTSYTNRIRGTYAGIGYTYNSTEDIFITPPPPFPSWTRSGSFWNAPIPMPTDGAMYSWDEEAGNWDAIA